MARTLQAAALPRIEARQVPAAATLTALGIVYGDIGTSPLYGFKQAADASGAITPETIIGIVSVILWSLIVIVSFKYAILIMRADNRGEGGIIALLALLDVRRAPAGSWRASLLIVGLVGAALLYGDGVITPAISVLSAVEGLKLDAPQLAPVVVPISIAILVGLFLVQRKGTAFIGNIFGPVMLIWFIVRKDETRFVLNAQIARHRQHALAFDFITENRDGEQVGAERHLTRMKERSARDREAVPACLAPPAGRSVGSAAVVNDRATAFRAERTAAIAGPADLAENGLSLLIRHPRDGR